MTFNHLEDGLGEKEVLPYLEFCEDLQEPTKTVFRYALDIGSHLESQGLLEDYVIIGGYAVLSNLMDTFGDEIAKTWRGSNDVDMAGDHRVWTSVKSGYNLHGDNESPNIDKKRTLKLDLDGEEECKIDFYLGNSVEKYGISHVNTHFGVPLRVLKPEYIIKGKLKTPEEQYQHSGDILAMISVLERKEEDPSKILKILNHCESDNLRKRIHQGEKRFRKDRFGFFPRLDYMKALKKGLRHQRSVR